MAIWYAGIDPSINSTGVCIIPPSGNPEFALVKPKLTKKESAISIPGFRFITYTKEEPTGDYHTDEYRKVVGMSSILMGIRRFICDIESTVGFGPTDELRICMEGVSYGSSLRTKSIYDLAGLNFLLRYWMYLSGDTFIIAPPSEIKKFATGKGNADKEAITNCFLMIFPHLSELKKSDDIADAYFMAQYYRECDRKKLEELTMHTI